MTIDRDVLASTLTAGEVLSRVYALCHGASADDDQSERLANLQDWLVEQDLDGATLGDLADAWSGLEPESGVPPSDW
jgi:hypothetical protein